MNVKLLLKASVMLAFSVVAFAEVHVVESKSLMQQQEEKFQQALQKQQAKFTQDLEQQRAQSSKINGQLYSQLQALQTELMRLQGTVEEQSYQIEQLKQQQLDGYQNLDKRISELAVQPPVASVPVAQGEQGAEAVTTAEQIQSGAANTQIKPKPGDKAAYQSAYAFIKAKQYDKAIESFNSFIEQYPNSRYQANAYYWMGELYLIDNKKEDAIAAFDQVIEKHKTHPKYPEALFKLGKVYVSLDKKTQGKSYLDELVGNFADSAPKTVSLAQKFIEQNYP